MDKIKKLFRYFRDSDYRFLVNAWHGLYKDLPDDLYLKRMFHAKMGYDLDLNKPITFNEKLQWLKLYDRKPVYTTMVDKVEAKKYVASVIGEEHIIPTFGVWDRAEDIDFDSLPNQFVLKCTHDSHGLIICKDKSKLDIEDARKKLSKALKRNYYLRFREWPYKDVKPRIIGEKYMIDSDGAEDLTDYKFYCFNGYVDCVMVCLDRTFGDTKFYFFDKDWNMKRINMRGKNAPADFTLPKPACIDEMFSIAAKLSEGIPFVRVDLYQSSGVVYFGELTFFPQSGFDPNYLPETDQIFGRLLDLSKVE